MAGGGSSSSEPVNMTPKAFKQLQEPYASVIGQLLGFEKVTVPPASGGGSGTKPAMGSTMGPISTGGSPDGQGRWSGIDGGYGAVVAGRTPGSPEQFMQSFASSGFGTPFGTQSSAGKTTYVPYGDPTDVLRGIPQYGGPLTAGIGDNEQMLLDRLMAMEMGEDVSPASAYLRELLGGALGMPEDHTTESLSAFTRMLQDSAQQPGYEFSEMNPFMQAAIEAAQRPTLQGLEEALTRDLPGRFTQAGQFVQPGGSSAFDRAAAIATRGAADAMGDIATNISFGTYEAERMRQFEAMERARQQEAMMMGEELARVFSGQQAGLDRQLEAARQLPGIQSMEVQNTIANLQAQALPRMIEELGIERGLEQFTNRLNSLLGVLGIGAGVTAPVIGQSSESETKPNIMPMFSDRALKSDITQIGTLPNGLGVYSYQMFGNWEVGVMADEVATVLPAAVHTGPGGYQMVDYGLVMEAAYGK